MQGEWCTLTVCRVNGVPWLCLQGEWCILTVPAWWMVYPDCACIMTPHCAYMLHTVPWLCLQGEWCTPDCACMLTPHRKYKLRAMPWLYLQGEWCTPDCACRVSGVPLTVFTGCLSCGWCLYVQNSREWLAYVTCLPWPIPPCSTIPGSSYQPSLQTCSMEASYIY